MASAMRSARLRRFCRASMYPATSCPRHSAFWRRGHYRPAPRRLRHADVIHPSAVMAAVPDTMVRARLHHSSMPPERAATRTVAARLIQRSGHPTSGKQHRNGAKQHLEHCFSHTTEPSLPLRNKHEEPGGKLGEASTDFKGPCGKSARNLGAHAFSSINRCHLAADQSPQGGKTDAEETRKQERQDCL